MVSSNLSWICPCTFWPTRFSLTSSHLMRHPLPHEVKTASSFYILTYSFSLTSSCHFRRPLPHEVKTASFLPHFNPTRFSLTSTHLIRRPLPHEIKTASMSVILIVRNGKVQLKWILGKCVEFNWIKLVQNRNQWPAVVFKMMNFWTAIYEDFCLTKLIISNHWRKNLS